MVDVDSGNRKYLILIFDSGHRTTVSLDHEEGLELYRRLKDYYSNVEFGGVPEKKSKLKKIWEVLTDATDSGGSKVPDREAEERA